jgi:hypothetical protein
MNMARKSKIPSDMSALLKTSSGTLAQIKAKTNSLTQLSDIVRQICPDLPADAWHIANFVKNTLVIEVKSPVWAQRLQFERNKICQQLMLDTDNQFSKIEIKINPFDAKRKMAHQISENTPVITHDNTANIISEKTARHLEDVAKNAPKGLREKLLKLASHRR